MISTVTEAAFAARRQPDWARLEQLVHLVSMKGHRALSRADVVGIPPLYSDACADLASARAARYSAPLVEYLQNLTAVGHTVLYGAVPRGAAASRRQTRHACGARAGLAAMVSRPASRAPGRFSRSSSRAEAQPYRS